MDLKLEDRIVVVTGASKGIGYACAAAFAREGVRGVLVSRSADNLDAAAGRFPATRHAPTAIAADMVRADEAERMVAEVERELGPIDVLVNSAAAARLKRMAPRGRGAVVNIVAMGGKVASPVQIPGGAADAALMLATAGLAAAFGPRGIRINAINPGGTLTGRVQEGLAVEAKMTGLAEAELRSDTKRRSRWVGSVRRSKSRAARCSSRPTRRVM